MTVTSSAHSPNPTSAPQPRVSTVAKPPAPAFKTRDSMPGALHRVLSAATRRIEITLDPESSLPAPVANSDTHTRASITADDSAAVAIPVAMRHNDPFYSQAPDTLHLPVQYVPNPRSGNQQIHWPTTFAMLLRNHPAGISIDHAPIEDFVPQQLAPQQPWVTAELPAHQLPTTPLIIDNLTYVYSSLRVPEFAPDPEMPSRVHSILARYRDPNPVHFRTPPEAPLEYVVPHDTAPQLQGKAIDLVRADLGRRHRKFINAFCPPGSTAPTRALPEPYTPHRFDPKQALPVHISPAAGVAFNIGAADALLSNDTPWVPVPPSYRLERNSEVSNVRAHVIYEDGTSETVLPHSQPPQPVKTHNQLRVRSITYSIARLSTTGRLQIQQVPGSLLITGSTLVYTRDLHHHVSYLALLLCAASFQPAEAAEPINQAIALKMSQNALAGART